MLNKKFNLIQDAIKHLYEITFILKVQKEHQLGITGVLQMNVDTHIILFLNGYMLTSPQ